MKIVRVFIASADKTFRLALLLLLESEPGVVVIGMADRAEGLPILIRASQPEVLLFDYELAKPAPINLIGDLHHLEHAPKIIVLALDPQVSAAVEQAGADAFVSKNLPPALLLPVLRRMRAQLGLS